MIRVVRPSTQVIDFAKRLAPESRRAIKHALAELRREQGDIRSPEANLSGYYRLRIGRHRIIFSYAADGAIDCPHCLTKNLTSDRRCLTLNLTNSATRIGRLLR